MKCCLNYGKLEDWFGSLMDWSKAMRDEDREEKI
jgi:hypothetical protein